MHLVAGSDDAQLDMHILAGGVGHRDDQIDRHVLEVVDAVGRRGADACHVDDQWSPSAIAVAV